MSWRDFPNLKNVQLNHKRKKIEVIKSLRRFVQVNSAVDFHGTPMLSLRAAKALADLIYDLHDAGQKHTQSEYEEKIEVLEHTTQQQAKVEGEIKAAVDRISNLKKILMSVDAAMGTTSQAANAKEWQFLETLRDDLMREAARIAFERIK